MATEFSARRQRSAFWPDLLVIDIEDSEGLGACIGELTYEEPLAEGSEDFGYGLPDDEWGCLLQLHLGYHSQPKGWLLPPGCLTNA